MLVRTVFFTINGRLASINDQQLVNRSFWGGGGGGGGGDFYERIGVFTINAILT